MRTVVNGFEARLFRLQLIQAAFFMMVLLLLGWGYRLTRHRILSPLTRLHQAAWLSQFWSSRGDISQRWQMRLIPDPVKVALRQI